MRCGQCLGFLQVPLQGWQCLLGKGLELGIGAVFGIILEQFDGRFVLDGIEKVDALRAAVSWVSLNFRMIFFALSALGSSRM
jgi:hypothetical protein